MGKRKSKWKEGRKGNTREIERERQRERGIDRNTIERERKKDEEIN